MRQTLQGDILHPKLQDQAGLDVGREEWGMGAVSGGAPESAIDSHESQTIRMSLIMASRLAERNGIKGMKLHEE